MLPGWVAPVILSRFLNQSAAQAQKANIGAPMQRVKLVFLPVMEAAEAEYEF